MADEKSSESSIIQRLVRIEWHVIAGVMAAMAAIIMHFLHVVEEDILLTILLVLIALLFLHDLRRESHAEKVAGSLERTEAGLERVHARLIPPDAILIGPRQLRHTSEKFSLSAQGEMIWFNFCMEMFISQEVFDLVLRPAIENKRVTVIHFILHKSQRPTWERSVLPKVEECKSGEKIQVCWSDITENVSFVLSDCSPEGTTECLLSYWGEPFMAGPTTRPVPRYIFHIQGHSELIARFAEIERNYRLCRI